MNLKSKIATAPLAVIIAVGVGSAAFGSARTGGIDERAHAEHAITPGVDDHGHHRGACSHNRGGHRRAHRQPLARHCSRKQ